MLGESHCSWEQERGLWGLGGTEDRVWVMGRGYERNCAALVGQESATGTQRRAVPRNWLR